MYKAYEKQDFVDVADAIREKTGKSAKIKFPKEFASEIRSISGGGEVDFLPSSDVSKILSVFYVNNSNGARSSGIVYGLDGNNYDATCYLVARSVEATSNYPRLITIPFASSTGNEPCVYTGSGNVGWTTFNSDEIVSGINELDTNLYVLSINNLTKKASLFINGIKIGEKAFNNSGSQVKFSVDQYYRFMVYMYGVVLESESDATIIANSNVIMNHFNIS